MSKELKPCPFCGGVAKLYGSSKITGTGFKHYQIVVCLNDDCGCRTGFCETVADAIEKWNTRKPIEKIVEELEEKVELAHKRYVDCPVNSPCYERYRTQYNERRMCLDIVESGGVNDD